MPFNPITSITGNGVSGQVVATYTTGSTSWNIVTQNLPGQALTGTFPNSKNAYSIQAQSFNYTWPFRGGKNLSASGTHSKLAYGPAGISDIGIVIFSPNSGIIASGQAGTRWTVNSNFAKIFGEDIYGGSPNAAGVYHYVDTSFITENAWANVTDFTGFTHTNGHSKIIGWAADGYPIYGPYGYVSPLNTSSAVVRTVSGYRANVKSNRPTNRTLVINGSVSSSTTFLVYSVSGIGPGMFITGNDVSTTTKILRVVGTQVTVDSPVSIADGNVVVASYPLGIFLEDWDYSPTTSTVLDVYNGRWCITPDYPDGTYAYFATEDANGTPTYPYLVGPSYYGSLVIDSNDSGLSNLTATAGTFAPAFNSTVTSYLLSIANTVTSVQLTPVARNANATIVVNSSTVVSGTKAPAVQLPIGYTTSTIKVTSQYKTTSTYTVTINRVRSGINTLSQLIVTPGAFTPTFNKNTIEYFLTIDKAVEQISILAFKEEPNATITINGTTATSGVVSLVDVVYGRNVIDIVVTAHNGDQRTYNIKAVRLSDIALLSNIQTDLGAITPAFDSGKYFYSINVVNTVTSALVKGTLTDSASALSINGGPYDSDTYSSPIDLRVGINIVDLRVDSSDGTVEHHYRLSVNRAFSSIAVLTGLFPSTGTLSPGFAENITSYTLSVGNNVTTIAFLPVVTEPYATIKINNITVASNVQSSPISLTVGNNTISVVVTAPDGITTQTYTVIVNRNGSGISTLTNLLVTNAVISPAFNPGITSYNAVIGYTIPDIQITPTAAQENAAITINNVSVLSGETSAPIPVSIGTNTIRTVVVSQNGASTSTYTLNVRRKANYDTRLSDIQLVTGEISPTFDSEVYEYSSFQSHFSTSTDIIVFTNDPDASLKINGVSTSSGAVTSIPLTGYLDSNDKWVGDTSVSIECFAADTDYVKTTTLVLTRVPNSVSTLSNLVIVPGTLTPSFDFEVTEYFVNLSFNDTAIRVTPTITDPGSTLSVAGISTVSGSSVFYPLVTGNNLVAVVVTASNSINYTSYNIYVNRAAEGLSSNALLAKLEVSTGTITPVFDPAVQIYRVSLDYATTSIKVKPTKAFTRASIRVNGAPVLSGEYSSAINLAPGAVTTITVLVTAEDRTSRPVEIRVSRAGNSDSTLTALLVNNGYLEPRFSKGVLNYTVNVPNYIRTIAVKPVVSNNQSQVSVNGLGVVLGNWSVPTNLSIGNNFVTVVVLSGDLINSTTYKVNFVRSSAHITSPVELFLIDGTGNVAASVPDPKSLRIYTRDQTSYVTLGTFPIDINPYAVTIQDIEVMYPYRGGEKIASVEPVLRSTSGNIGISVVGIPLRAPNSNITVTGTNSVWTLDAVSKFYTGDEFGGRPDSHGAYYYTDNRFITNGAWNNTLMWYGDYTHDDGHSKIIGFAADGYPIYGPYGYSEPINANSTVSLVKSGYTAILRAGRPSTDPVSFIVTPSSNGTTFSVNDASNIGVGMTIAGGTIATGTNVFVVSITGNTLTTNSDVNAAEGTPFTASYTLGSFIEDWIFTGTEPTTLDRSNGRYCVTPDYPFGTYAYFTTRDTIGNPTYPYIVGNTFYGDLSNKLISTQSAPVWVTPPGFIVTATETVSISRRVSALGNSVSYKVITGALPPGLNLNTSTGYIAGTPSVVYQVTNSEFVIRAQNTYGVADRKFYIDVRGETPPIITTPGPAPAIGPSGEDFLINNQFVDFQFTATADIIPAGKSLRFFIEDGDGQLPPGLTLTQSGHLYGQVKDTLSLFYRSASDGTYDAEGYDFAPYEHISQQAYGVSNRYVNKVYKFFLSVANGASVNKAQYVIYVNDPSTFINMNAYPIAPQWLTPSDLGSVRSNTTQIIKLDAYDCDPGSGTIRYEWFDANGNDASVLPPDLTLDTQTGIISGMLRYSPTYSSTYTFNVRVIKTNIVTNMTRYRDKSFTLTILGAVLSQMTFETAALAGTLSQGETSELAIKAVHSDPTLKITYTLLSGSLPTGLSFASDGAIQGAVAYNAGITSTTSYTITVKATDSNLTSELTKTFTIKVLPYTGIKYTKILLQPLLPLAKREIYTAFISDQNVFDPALLYRPYDPAFGVQTVIDFTLEYGIKELNLEAYVPAIQNYFSRKKLYFGNLKSAFATDSAGNKTYEVVYVEIVDTMVNNDGVSVGAELSYDNTVIYPNSIDNMRGALESLTSVDEYLLPKFMRTIQDNTGIPLGRILCMPLCYCLPGNSQTIIRRIEATNFDFKLINFDIDRLTVLNTLDNSSAKYLLFPNREV